MEIRKIYNLNTHNAKKFNDTINYFASQFVDLNIKAQILNLIEPTDYVTSKKSTIATERISVLATLKELRCFKNES